jgi:hypothetical protein
MRTVTFLLLIASPGTALWGQSQKLIEMADTSHLPDNPFSHMHECLCLHVGILPFAVHSISENMKSQRAGTFFLIGVTV